MRKDIPYLCPLALVEDLLSYTFPVRQWEMLAASAADPWACVCFQAAKWPGESIGHKASKGCTIGRAESQALGAGLPPRLGPAGQTSQEALGGGGFQWPSKHVGADSRLSARKGSCRNSQAKPLPECGHYLPRQTWSFWPGHGSTACL